MSVKKPELNIEWLADVGESELLLPRPFVRTAFGEGEFGLGAVEEVASTYGASLEATARRYAASPPSKRSSQSSSSRRASPTPPPNYAQKAPRGRRP